MCMICMAFAVPGAQDSHDAMSLGANLAWLHKGVDMRRAAGEVLKTRTNAMSMGAEA